MTESEPEKYDAQDAHEEDQARANAHKLIDSSEEFVIVSINKDGSIGRIRNSTEFGCLTMIGCLMYEIHRLKLYMDDKQKDTVVEEDEEEEEETEK